MEALRKVALAYYNSGTDQERSLFNQFFQSMDKDGNRRVSYREFSDFMSQKAHDENMRTRDFFNQLDIDRSGGLDFNEVLTLYYILKSGRPICGQCKIFITNEYFACMKCFETGSAAYSICLECFRDEGSLNHNHVRLYFVDNFSLLESLRKKPLPNHQQPSLRSNKSQVAAPSLHSCSESSSQLGIVTYNHYIPEEGRNPWQVHFRLLEAGLHLAAGYEAPNLRKLADKIAAAGFYVAVPDFLHGDPYVPNAGRTLQDWIKDHGTDKAFEDAKPVIQAIKSKVITAIGAAGFCWGAKVAVQLAKREFIQAAVLLHPSFVTVDDIKSTDS